MKQYLFVLGAGNVGREFIKRVQIKDSSEFHKNPSVIVGVSEPGCMIFKPNGIDDDLLTRIANFDKSALKGEMKYESMDEILQLVEESELKGKVIFVDLTAGKDELLDFHRNVISNSSCSIVTANKNPISLYTMDDFNLLTKFHHRYDANVTVMGGAGIVNFINERREIRDEIKSIQGCFSGTLGYILSELEKGEKVFSEIVKSANDEGYTEPNPWDDLNGLDVARKILILARYAGHDVSIADVNVEPLIEKSFGKLEGEEFFKALKQKDEYFTDLQKKARKDKKVLRYVAEMINKNGNITLKVGPRMMPQNGEFGSLKGTANLVVVDTSTLADPIPHVIKSQGAGLEVTADAIRTGILKLIPHGIGRE